MYTEQDRASDFDFFIDNFDALFEKYGRCYLAIKDREILGQFSSAAEAVDHLSGEYDPGTYIVQKCFGDKRSYTATITRLLTGKPA